MPGKDKDGAPNSHNTALFMLCRMTGEDFSSFNEYPIVNNDVRIVFVRNDKRPMAFTRTAGAY